MMPLKINADTDAQGVHVIKSHVYGIIPGHYYKQMPLNLFTNALPITSCRGDRIPESDWA